MNKNLLIDKKLKTDNCNIEKYTDQDNLNFNENG